MNSSESYLPSISNEDIEDLISNLGLPKPLSISYLPRSAVYHSIYSLTMDGSKDERLKTLNSNLDGFVKLILRVSGNHIPRTKTLNEVAIMHWVEQHTSIPTPKVVAWDASPNNPVTHEFTLLECVEGISIDKIYPALTSNSKEYITKQLADFVIELHSHSFTHVGGLSFDANETVIPGPVVEVRSWQMPSLLAAWGSDTSESLNSLNPQGPFDTWTDYATARLKISQYALYKHPSLQEACQRLDAQIEKLIAAIEDRKAELNPHSLNPSYVLAHKDMHLGNVMCDPDTCKITAVLDWEFAQITPLPAWNPGNFLWNGLDDASSESEKVKLLQVFDEHCRESGKQDITLVEMTKQQEGMQLAVEWLGWIVRDTATGLDNDRIRGDHEGFQKALKLFGL